MATGIARTRLKIIISLAAGLVFIGSLLGGGHSLLAQNLAVPGNMPTLYGEIPAYALARKRARYKVKLCQGIIESRGVQGGYVVKNGGQEFVILNQNPACLKRFAGKMVAVTGRTTESVVPWFDMYFLVIDEINCMKYEGKVAPWAMREPTDEEVRFWTLHRRLPPATERFMAYLDLSDRDGWASWNGAPAPGDLSGEPGQLMAEARSPRPVRDLDQRLTDIQSQLTVIEKRVSRKPYQGLYSTPPDQWNATDWSLYMDSQGGG